MKRIFKTALICVIGVLFSLSVIAQTSTNTVKYKITYDATTQLYTTWVIPDYSVPNANNTGTTEKGGTAQFTIVVPKDFLITQITDIKGTWAKPTDTGFTKLGPGNTGQSWTGLDPNLNYYVVGKTPSETDYGTFTAGTPVSLFSFKGNGCFGPVQPLPAGDPFIAAADNNYSLNVANSFYSRSGQPAGGNIVPLEQFIDKTGTPANCSILANPDVLSAGVGTTTIISVLPNDKTGDGATATLTNVTAPTITTQPTKGTLTINPDGTFNYVPTTGATGTDTFIYQICDKSNPTVCDTAKVTLNLSAAPAPIANPDVTTATIGSATIIPVLSNDKSATGTTATLTNVTAPVVTTLPAKGTVTVNADGTISYTPNAGTSGTDTFIYTICDKVNTTSCDTAKVTITIGCPAIAPPESATASPNPICAGSPSTLSGTCTTGTITWFSDVNLTTAVTSPVSPTTTTDYYGACVSGTCKSTGVKVTVTVSATACNFPPVVIGEPIVARPGEQVQVCMTITDPNTTDTHTATPCNTATKGTSTLSVNNTTHQLCITYTAGSTPGTELLCVIVCDNGSPSKCDTVYVPVTIVDPTPPTSPAPPVVIPVPIVTDPGVPVTVCMPIIDTPTDTHTSTICNPVAAKGTATATVNNTTDQVCVTYTPTAGKTGSDEICLIVCDQTGKCDTVKIPVTITTPLTPPTNPQPPIVTPTIITTNPGVPVTVCTGIQDPNVGDTFTSKLCSAPANGTATTTVNNTTDQVCITYTPNAGFTGNDEVCLIVCDQTGLCDTIKIPVTVIPVSVPCSKPTLTAGNPVCNSNGTYNVSFISSASSITASSGTVSGNTVTGIAAGTDVTITATTGTGCETVIKVIAPTSCPPTGGCTAYPKLTIGQPVCNGTTMSVAFSVDLGTVTSNVGTVSGSSIINIPLGSTLTVTATNGTCISKVSTILPTDCSTPCFNPGVSIGGTKCQSNGTYQITFVATTGVTVSSSAGTVNMTTGMVSGIPSGMAATLTAKLAGCADNVTVVPAPTCATPIIYAYNDNAVTNKGVAVSGNVLINDNLYTGTGPLVVTTTPVTQPTNGTVTLNANGTYTYTPNAGFTGVDSFKYQVCDSSVPAVCTTAIVTINVTDPAATNHPPIALTDNIATPTGQAVSGNVLTNDTDPDAGQTLTASLVTGPAHGTLILNPDGTYTYTPTAGYVRPDQFTYKACDNGTPQLCTTAIVAINVTPTGASPMPPVANADLFTRCPTCSVTGNVLTNDKDPNGLLMTVTTTPVVQPAHGTVTINSDGTFTYTPSAGYTGSDLFTYQVCNSAGLCTQAVVIILPKAAPIGTSDLSITKTLVGSKTRAINDVVTYTVVVKNLGPDAATNVVVKDSVSAGLALLSGTTTKGTFSSPLWSIPSIASGDSAVLTVTAKVLTEGLSYNWALIKKSDQTDGNTSNNTTNACVTVPFSICSGQGIDVSVPAGLINVVWKDAQGNIVPSNNGNATLTKAGTYTFTATNGTCPTGGCCPVVVVDGNCCPTNICIPFTTVKRKL